ncbi:hypothetical protein M5K25_022265 [Dendrobium thyrsiflorum]|uniref:B box-type domain-containing protein n=1 Tax=Dendrobium thyrsiflorum TaxID=117978 RepID=A0ABD0U610_DENTH
MMNVLLAIEGIRRKSALELEVDPRLLSSKNPVAGGPSSSKKKPLKYFKDQKGKHKSGSKSQKEKKKKLARKKTMIQKYIDSTDEYQQPPRRPVMLEEYMADLFLNSESEEEESIPIETCRVISKRGGRAARGRNIPLDICKADVKMSSKEVHRTPAPFTDSDEELHFHDEESDHKGKKILKERCPKLGSSSDSEEVEDMKISKNSQTEASSSSEKKKETSVYAMQYSKLFFFLKFEEQVHKCNKLAGRHVRVGLADPSEVPRCDICEVSPAFFYCEIDGSSLCLQCDTIVHVGGKRTHARYLLLRQRVEGQVEDASLQNKYHSANHMDLDHLSHSVVREKQQNHDISPPTLIANSDHHGNSDSKMIDLNKRPSQTRGQASNMQEQRYPAFPLRLYPFL